MPPSHPELGDLLDACARRWRERVIEGCVAAGFPNASQTTCQVLRPLFDTDGLPISEVGSRAGLAKSSMTTIVRHLVEEGFVVVSTDPDDHRVKRLELTPKARELERAIDDGVTRLRHRVTATLGPQGREQLHKTLERLLHAL
ncbi:MAG: MarR family transcriptional regulator [Gemmatimonadota bacterium]|nr:MarR family transcriptional regulator [Gemmatimonadota bacterium]